MIHSCSGICAKWPRIFWNTDSRGQSCMCHCCMNDSFGGDVNINHVISGSCCLHTLFKFPCQPQAVTAAFRIHFQHTHAGCCLGNCVQKLQYLTFPSDGAAPNIQSSAWYLERFFFLNIIFLFIYPKEGTTKNTLSHHIPTDAYEDVHVSAPSSTYSIFIALH